MVENDIYNNMKRFETFKAGLSEYLEEPQGKRKYRIKNRENIKYFKKLFRVFEIRDTSYIRRLRLCRSFLIVTHVIEKDLSEATRDDINRVIAYFHSRNFSAKSIRDFSLDLRFIWRQILPEKDDKGRDDETLVPYAVRHLSGRVDRSREKTRKDRFSVEEFEKLVSGFGDDVRMQAFLTSALENLARPQELLFIRNRGVSLFDNYAKLEVSEHGKEGPKVLLCIDSYPYIARWHNEHPLKNDPDAFFFCTIGNKRRRNKKGGRHTQLSPEAINKNIRVKCKKLGIDTPITCYSLKRNGVTIRRLRGDSDVTIQHIAGWTSTRQLKTYDLSNAEDTFRLELMKRGLIKPEKGFREMKPLSRKCLFCGCANGIADSICDNCKRPLDRKAIEQDIREKEEKINMLEKQMRQVQQILANEEFLNLARTLPREELVKKS